MDQQPQQQQSARTERLKKLLFDQVALIKNDDIRDLVSQVLARVPENFWTRESSKKYHLWDERQTCGNLLHTLRVIKMTDIIYTTQTYNQRTKDVLRAAALMHDCLKHGLDGTSYYMNKDHPLLIRRLIKEQLPDIKEDLTEEVCKVIETHMGSWGPVPFSMELSSQEILHLADVIEASGQVQFEV